MTYDEMIAVLRAHKEGKTIQSKLGKEWADVADPTWNFGTVEYRVKPEDLKKVKMLCWYDGTYLYWVKKEREKSLNWIRVPSEDEEIELP